MNEIILKKANIFDNFDEYDFLVGMGTLGFSILGTAYREFLKQKNLKMTKNPEFETLIKINENGKLKELCLI